MDLSTSETAHGHLAFTGLYKPVLFGHFVRLLASGGLLVDAGGNFGYFSLLRCVLSSSTRSIAFEAAPKVLLRLKQNISTNIK